jgi:DNA polymerase-2
LSDAWLLDITEDRRGHDVVLWLKDDGPDGRVRPVRRPFRPPFLVDGPREHLKAIAKRFTGAPDVATIEWRTERPSIFDRRPRRLLSITPERNDRRRRVATAVDAFGGYHRGTLYDVDLAPPQLYHLAFGLYPFAPVREEGERYVATLPAEAIDYPLPPLRVARLAAELAGVRRGGIVRGDPPLAAVVVGDARIEGAEPELFDEVMAELARQDPDILLTDDGDGFDLPCLYRRAAALGRSEEEFFLGREPVSFRPARPARSFATYGQVLHREASFPLPGRFHLDRENSFLYGDAAIDGLIDAARLSRLSLQTVVRQSPGTCFTAMEMAHALEGGAHVPFRKNRPEEFKSAHRLVEADRGGVIFLPPVGVHDRIDEFDFASLYPHIMVRHNLSTETLNCRCCPKSPEVVPGLGYRSCVRRTGLIPTTLEPLLARRLAYKAAIKRPGTPPAEVERLKRRVKMLKWILVTAFGYQGYRNARFGRIECHEAINAYARELIVRLVRHAEERGYRVVHGIVDSLWLAPRDPAKWPDAEAFARSASEEFDLPLGYEGRYRWIVFLPSVTGIGVPNRYYGLYESGAFKLRGVGSRRHDTPLLLRRFEGEILDMMKRAPDAPAVLRLLPRLLARTDRFAEQLKERRWPVEELLITHRLSQEVSAYVTFTDSVAAMRQLADAGVTRMPGESVRFVVRDRRSRSWRDRVRVAELLEPDDDYDVGAYLELMARSAETLLAPLGVKRAALLERWGVAPAPERDRYRSVEGRAQRALPVA